MSAESDAQTEPLPGLGGLSLTTLKKIDTHLESIGQLLLPAARPLFTVPVETNIADAVADLRLLLTELPLGAGIYIWYVEAPADKLVQSWNARMDHYQTTILANSVESESQILITSKGKLRPLEVALSPLSQPPAQLLSRLPEAVSSHVLYVGESGGDSRARLQAHCKGSAETGSLKLGGCIVPKGLNTQQRGFFQDFVEKDLSLMDQAGITSISCLRIGMPGVAHYRRRTYEGILREALLPVVGAR